MITRQKVSICGLEVDVFSLVNSLGSSAKIISYGATLTELKVPDRDGNYANVVLGFDNLSSYFEEHPYFGSTIGRYANRIAEGKFDLNGVTYQLETNDGKHTLHGGSNGFHKRPWEVVSVFDGKEAAITLRQKLEHMEDGFPGALVTDITYVLTDENQLKIAYIASSDRPTPVNLTHHSYFNLKGAGNGDILDHELYLAAHVYTEVGCDLIPTGELKPVAETPLDFTRPHLIGERIDKLGPGYDHNFVLTKTHGSYALAARVSHRDGRAMEMWTTAPGVQFYSGNYLDGSLVGIGGAYERFGGFCLEAQHFPNSVNHGHFPTTIISVDAPYKQLTTYKFGTCA